MYNWQMFIQKKCPKASSGKQMPNNVIVLIRGSCMGDSVIPFCYAILQSCQLSQPLKHKNTGQQSLCHYKIFFMHRSLVISSSPFQSAYARLNPYDRQHHCEKQIPYDIHGKSILLLGHRGACINLLQDAIALLIYELINYVHSFCSNIFHLNG